MKKVNLTNKHEGRLFLAGVDTAPGKTIAVAEEKFLQWRNGNGAKVWIEQGIVTHDHKEDPADARADLEARAAAVGFEFNANLGDKKLKEGVEKAEAAAKAEEEANEAAAKAAKEALEKSEK
jgi:hypothetical protein